MPETGDCYLIFYLTQSVPKFTNYVTNLRITHAFLCFAILFSRLYYFYFFFYYLFLSIFSSSLIWTIGLIQTQMID